ncbi:hypothetical protein PIB30_052552, partial [Stylosanthes scabra]|nr:hypothetical protein [Stylosanthes scabra]
EFFFFSLFSRLRCVPSLPILLVQLDPRALPLHPYSATPACSHARTWPYAPSATDSDDGCPALSQPIPETPCSSTYTSA